MKFSQSTLAILKNFSRINSSIMLSKGNTILTSAVNSTIFAEGTVDSTIDMDVGIYDLNQFLSIMSLMGEGAEVVHDESNGLIVIKNEISTINFDSADPQTIVYPKKAIQFPDAQVVFELKSSEYSQLFKVCRSMKIDTLCINNQNDKIVITGYKKSTDDSFKKPIYQSVVGEFEGDDDHKFEFYINMDNIKDLLESDYTIHLFGKEGPDGNYRFAAKFEGEQVSYVVVMEEFSSINF